MKASAQPPMVTVTTKTPMLLTVCITIAASRPPVRQVITDATAANRTRSASTHGSGLPCAAANAAAPIAVEITSATSGRARYAPTFCMTHPRNTYSSAAACPGVSSRAMTRSTHHWSGRPDCGGSTRVEMAR